MDEVLQHPRLGPVTLAQSRRARRITLSVRPSGAVRLSYPCGIARARALAFLESRAEWVVQARERLAARAAARPSISLPDIETLRRAAQAELPGRVAELARLHTTRIPGAALAEPFAAAGLAPAPQGGEADKLLLRPGVTYELLAGIIGRGEGVDARMAGRIETELKYAGYIERQQRQVRQVQRQENTPIPPDLTTRPSPACGWKHGKSWPVSGR